MPTPFSSQDLSRVFDARTLTRGRSLVLSGAVQVALDGETVTVLAQDATGLHTGRITPAPLGRRAIFDSVCSCRIPRCLHLAAGAFAALDQFPTLRRLEQQSFIDTLVTTPVSDPQRALFELAPGPVPQGCMVRTLLIGERSGAITATTPRQIAENPAEAAPIRAIAARLGGGDDSTALVPPGLVPDILEALLQSGQARWHAGGKRRLFADTPRLFEAASAASLPAGSAVIFGQTGPWYVDAFSGAVGRVRVKPAAVPARPAPSPPAFGRPGAPKIGPRRDPGAAAAPRGAAISAPSSTQVIVDRAPVKKLRLTRFPCPNESGRVQDTDALLLEFDYGGTVIAADDERQFVRMDTPAGQVFTRRDRAAEAAALEAIRQDGFVQMRMADAKSARGRLVFLFRGRDAAESWQRFVAERLPALQAGDWRSQIDAGFGPREAGEVGACDLQVADAAQGGFSLDFGIEIDGVRHALLPILLRLRDRGGMAAARITDGSVVTSLDDGRILKLPAARMARLLAVVDDLMDAARHATGNTLVLEAAEAAVVLDLEDVVATRWQDGAAIAAQLARLRGVEAIEPVHVPAAFAGSLRPYQQEGVNWLQHLRAQGMGGLLADDMGLGKTAQTIAHLVIEHDSGRMTQPALVVVPTSLVPNWRAELARFAPHLRVLVLHGTERHGKLAELDAADVVITTYTVLTRDIEAMATRAWHSVVLDEAQAIKSAAAKTTHAVCRLQTGNRLCLSGTPIENNLGELWSQFAFLLPGLLGSRKQFTQRYRTPIEKNNDPVRQRQLTQRIRPFILRRTKSAVATELPPKHTILRRVTLAPAQRELYDTIRATLHAQVTQEIATNSLARSQIMVLDALLKLRQACCDPRLVKLPSAREIDTSSKLDDLLDMVVEMIAEGRKILLFSQFTSMLDLIKPRLAQAGIAFVELRGDTRDRETPVREFEAGEVPLFLISLKAGGRGLNLVAADTVIHYDPWWNPAVEDQASDRAHRIGQTKPVFVYKLIAADTVEERILDLQERKAALANLAFGTEGGGGPAMDVADVDYLFGAEGDALAA